MMTAIVNSINRCIHNVSSVIKCILTLIVLWSFVTGICTVQIVLTSMAIVCHIISICIHCVTIMFASHIIIDTS